MKHARRPVKARVIPPKIIQKYFKRIADLETDVARILEEESAEKEIAKLENRANRMQNQLETVIILSQCDGRGYNINISPKNTTVNYYHEFIYSV